MAPEKAKDLSWRFSVWVVREIVESLPNKDERTYKAVNNMGDGQI